ncbi:PDZ domain-containing protein [Streptomyces sp. NPDC127038]|uniref:PDZ domain-containing protein n=1 Tax=Streptomyces sp. NPDC127038 TaxID=3347114 RepID=UPI003647A2E9
MEQAALRPKPMPGRDPGGTGPSGGARASGGTRPPDRARPPRGSGRPREERRRVGRLFTLSAGVLAGAVLVLSGVGIGAVGVTVIGAGGLSGLREQAVAAGWPWRTASAPAVSGAPGPADTEARRGTLGVEAVDAPGGAGALVVAVHDPGPGRTAGLVRGDVLLALDGTRITSAAGLARAVADAAPGREVTLRVRHADGGRGHLTAVPGTAT